jgi:hypothetical protein
MSGDFSAMLSLLAPDAELRFVGVDVGPFVGGEAIAQAFRDRPPTDKLQLIGVLGQGSKATAIYGWSAKRDVRAGTLVLTTADGRISRLTISVQA